MKVQPEKKITLYKFRSLNNKEDIDFVIDIFENNRLYAAKFNELNDPMEGVYLSEGLTPEQLESMKEEKLKHGIVSLTKTNTDGFMWVFYADQCSGICIEVVPDVTGGWHSREIRYDTSLPVIKKGIKENYLSETDNILTRKLKRWSYEKEVRYLSDDILLDKDRYFPIKISRVFLGHKIGEIGRIIIKELVNRSNKGRATKDVIEIIEMTRRDYTWA